MSDGGYVLSGSVGLYGSITGYTYVMRTTAQGERVWCWAFPFSKPDLRVHDARPTADGGFVAISTIYRLGADNPDMMLIKADQDGNTGCFNQQWLTPIESSPTVYVFSPDIPQFRAGFTVTEVLPEERNVEMPSEDMSSYTAVEETGQPVTSELIENYPNPFNPSTTIRFTVPTSGNVSLKVFDMLGRQVAILVDGLTTAGEHRVSFSGSGLAAGVYICRFELGTQMTLKKMVLLK
jgi:hypothetical protein